MRACMNTNMKKANSVLSWLWHSVTKLAQVRLVKLTMLRYTTKVTNDSLKQLLQRLFRSDCLANVKFQREICAATVQ